jgi:prepilin peptidase CpaA
MLLNILLILVLVICFITDLRVQKIYNKVVFPSLAVAVTSHTLFYGYNGLKLSLLGFLTGLGILFVPYFLGGIGAGDVKLLALIGAIKGNIFVMNTAIYMALIGGAIAIIIIMLQKETISFIKALFLWAASFFHGTRYKPEFSTTVLLKKYPYGIAITAGAAICLIFKGAWII